MKREKDLVSYSHTYYDRVQTTKRILNFTLDDEMRVLFCQHSFSARKF